MNTHRLINPNDPKVTAIQSRHHTSLELIEEYAAQMADGLQFDPCSAIETPDGHIYIWDGKHRLEAAIRNGAMLLCELEPGTEQDARWKACSANKKHGLKRSNADIQQAVQEAITLRPDKSDREIGLWVGCDHKTVGKYRKDMEVSGDIPQIPTRTVVRGEQEYQMKMPTPTKSEPVETPPALKSTPTQNTLKGVIKAFMSLRFEPFTRAYEELGHLCNCWQSREPYVSLVNELKEHLESLYSLPEFHFTTRAACRAAYDEWTALYESGYRGVFEPEAPASAAGEQDATAQQILDTLEQNQSWVNPIVKRFADSKYFPYDTTDMKLFREVTIRKPTGETNRFGDERLKRCRLDGVAVIKINDHRYKPILVGFEVKVDKHDLLNDKKMHEYLDYVDMFFLVIPRTLGVAYIDFHQAHPYKDQIGNLVVEQGSVDSPEFAEILHPGERERQELVTELLMKTLWKEAQQVHTQP